MLNIVYLLLTIFVSILFGIPPLRWLYRSYVRHMIEVASEKVSEYQKQISERLSDAGRKVSQKMRT